VLDSLRCQISGDRGGEPQEFIEVGQRMGPSTARRSRRPAGRALACGQPAIDPPPVAALRIRRAVRPPSCAGTARPRHGRTEHPTAGMPPTAPPPRAPKGQDPRLARLPGHSPRGHHEHGRARTCGWYRVLVAPKCSGIRGCGPRSMIRRPSRGCWGRWGCRRRRRSRRGAERRRRGAGSSTTMSARVTHVPGCALQQGSVTKS
jgi:hypothetical protein